MMRYNFLSLHHIIALIVLTCLTLFTLSSAPLAHAGGSVENCADDSAFSSVLIGGGTVTFNCGTATILLSSTKTISANTTIDGGGTITLSGGFARRLFVINGGITLNLKNIVLKGGYGSDGDGGTIVNNGFLSLDHTTIQDATTSNYYGGAIATSGSVDVANSAFINNKAGSGGAIYATGAAVQLNINRSDFHDNSVSSNLPNSRRGGAIYLTGGAVAKIFDTTFDNNAGGYGGAIANIGATLNLTGVTLTNNKLQNGHGGAIANEGAATLSEVTFTSNSTRYGDGGAIYNKGTANLVANTFSANSSSYGGGIANDHGTLVVAESTFTTNSANVAGGGGIANEYGTITLTDVTVSGNFATGDAGGVENGRGTATLTNVTLSDNYASSGGGMWNLYGGVATLTNVTIFGNSAYDLAGGLGNTNDPDTHLNLYNVIIANSKSGDNCVFQKDPDTSVSNLSSDATCKFGLTRDSVAVKLGPLETNGGNTLTHRPLIGSPAIDSGTSNGCPSHDQRGVSRNGSPCDVGAVELIPCAIGFTTPAILTPPRNAKLTTTQVPLDWAGPDCVKRFSVVVRRDSKTGPIVFSQGKLKTSQAETTALPANHTYFWQVTACVKKRCVTSEWQKFKLK